VVGQRRNDETTPTKRQERRRLRLKEQRLARAFCVLVYVIQVLVLILLSGVLALGPTGLVAVPMVGLVVAVVLLYWAGWPYRKWYSGPAEPLMWGSVVVAPWEMVDRSGWDAHRIWVSWWALGGLDLALLVVAAFVR